MQTNSIFKPNIFNGKVAVVTGGGSGIGEHVTQEIASLGCDVMIASRTAAKLEATKKRIQSDLKSPCGTVDCTQCDVSEETSVINLMKSTLARFKRIDYLVNCAGTGVMGMLSEYDATKFNQILDIDLRGTILCMKEAHKQWMSEHGGAIVNIAMTYDFGSPGYGYNAAAKAAVGNIAMTAAVEWAPCGIRVNTVAPSIVEVASLKVLLGEQFDVWMSSVASAAPAQRVAQPEEIAALVCYLLSPAAAFVTGQKINIDGGYTLAPAGCPMEPHDKCPAFTWKQAS